MNINREKLINDIKAYGRKNRLILCLFALFCAFAVTVLIFVANNHSFYEKTIVKIVSIEEIEDHVEYSVIGDKRESFYLQKITAVFLNGVDKGELVSLENIRSESNVYDTRFYMGDEIFISENYGEWEIDGVKRDFWVAATLLIFFGALLLVGRKKGIAAFLSLCINIALLWAGINLYINGFNLMAICIAVAVLFTVICLLLIGGFTRMTVISIISTLVGSAVTFGIACAVIYGFNFNGLYVEGLDFLVISIDYRITFMSQLLLGGLGAIMDIAVSVSSAMTELVRRDPFITYGTLLRSGRQVGRDITGTMANVLLFTYLCGSLPLLVVIVSNGVPLLKYIFANCNLEIARFLVGSIGIVVTVPISCYLSAFLLTRKNKKGTRSKGGEAR